MRQTRSSCVSGEDTREAEMQKGQRWVVRERTTGKWVMNADGGPPLSLELTDDLAEALRYGTRFRAEDDSSYLSQLGRDRRTSLFGMLFDVYEFDSSDRSRQVLPHLVFTPEERPERRKRKP